MNNLRTLVVLSLATALAPDVLEERLGKVIEHSTALEAVAEGAANGDIAEELSFSHVVALPTRRFAVGFMLSDNGDERRSTQIVEASSPEQAVYEAFDIPTEAGVSLRLLDGHGVGFFVNNEDVAAATKVADKGRLSPIAPDWDRDDEDGEDVGGMGRLYDGLWEEDDHYTDVTVREIAYLD